MSNIKEFAKKELSRLYKDEEEANDEYNKMAENAVLEIIDVFERQGHSGHSAAWCVGVLSKLLSWEPLTPLTGEDDEWTDVSYTDNSEHGKWYQNKRCSRVFKDDTGAYDSNGRVFTDPSGCSFTGLGSRVYIEFPYTPNIEYVQVDDNGEPLDGPSREELSNPKLKDGR